MGSSSSDVAVTQRRARIAKYGLQVFIVLYVVCYAIFYRSTHLRIEPVTGDVHLDGWLDRSSSASDALAKFGYCAYRVDDAPVGACLMALRATQVVGGESPGRLMPGERVIVASASHTVDGYLMIDVFPLGAVYLQDMQLCDQPAALGQRRRCAYVNDVDLHSFKDGNFIPTYVQVIHQRAACVDGTSDISSCQLDYPTAPEFEQQIDEFFIGAVEKHKVQLTHTFQSETLGQLRMDQATSGGVSTCSATSEVVFCRDPADGGHDLTSVEKLLSVASLSLSSNNAETDHTGRRETFRTSGIKLHIKVRYSNLEGFWSWTGTGEVGYSYSVEQVPAESVWRSKTITRKEEMRAWVSGERLADFAEHDRMLIWADGIELGAHVYGRVGHLDLSALLLVLASAAPLLFFSKALVSCVCGVGLGSDCEAMDEDGSAAASILARRAESPDSPRSGDDAYAL